jgi:hypothetical protein
LDNRIGNGAGLLIQYTFTEEQDIDDSVTNARDDCQQRSQDCFWILLLYHG